MRKRLCVLLSSILCFGLLTGCDDVGDDAVNEKIPITQKVEKRIALITKDASDKYWVTINEGAQRAAQELGVTVTHMAPEIKDTAKQLAQINNAVAQGYGAIVVAADDPDAVGDALQSAAAAGVKIIYVDSPANFVAEASCLTDNEEAGRLAGEMMLQELETDGITAGTIAVIGRNAASASTMKRDMGFRAALEDTGFTVLETLYDEGDALKSHTIAEYHIIEGADGIFGTSAESTEGIGNAIRSQGSTTVCVGFGDSAAISKLIRNGFVRAALSEKPDLMGYEGVKAAVAALDGEELGGRRIDTGVAVRTKKSE